MSATSPCYRKSKTRQHATSRVLGEGSNHSQSVYTRDPVHSFITVSYGTAVPWLGPLSPSQPKTHFAVNPMPP